MKSRNWLALLLAAICFIHVHIAAAQENGANADIEKIAREAKSSVVQVSFSGRDGKRLGLGTGFIISPDGLIATNLHVIGEARPISVELSDKRKFDVTTVHASDRTLDLALIRIDAKDLPALPLGNSERVEQGASFAAIGNPLGLQYSVVSGVVSGRREIEGRKMLQLAMPIERGNSGGPVIDKEGHVIGIVTMKSLVTENLGFAVEINELKRLQEKPNPVPISSWLTIGTLDPKQWTPRFGGNWSQRSGRITASGTGADPIGRRMICVAEAELPALPFELGVAVRLEDEAGAAGLIFHSDGGEKHYGFYPSAGKLRLSRFEGPSVFHWHVLQEIESEHYRPGEWNHLKVRFEQDKFKCFVNDQLVIESADDVLPAGKSGLAKFRDTVADFKQFRVAKEIPPTQIPQEKQLEIDRAIAQLPPLATLKPDQLRPLAAEPLTSAAVLRDKARQLEIRAKELERIAADVHTLSVTADLKAVFGGKEESIDLLRGALALARLDDDELDAEHYVQRVDAMAAEIKRRWMKDADEQEKLAALNKYLFAENGFHGSRTNYYHRANSYLNNVIDDREGLPITLSVLYIELGRRLGLQIEGVGLPGHFIVRHVPTEGDGQLVDVFEGGTLLSREDAAGLVRNFAGRELQDEDLRTSTKKEIVLRMLRNLLRVAQDNDNKEAMLGYVEAMLATDGELIQERGMRAILRYQTGRRDAAVADLDWFLENRPEGIDLEAIRGMRDRFVRGIP